MQTSATLAVWSIDQVRKETCGPGAILDMVPDIRQEAFVTSAGQQAPQGVSSLAKRSDRPSR